MNQPLFNKLRIWENGHIALWLVKDTCWLLDYKPMALFMAGPTITLAFYLTWRLRNSPAELAHNLAVCSWIGGNMVWMLGEFYADDTWRPYAKWFFFLGIAVLLYYYGKTLLGTIRAN